MDRIVKGTAATISVVLYSDGAATNPTPDTATVEVLRADGTVLVASTAATDAGTGIFTYTLTPTHTASLDVLTARWTATIGGFAQTVETAVEIVGGVYFTIAEARTLPSLSNTVAYTTAVITEARTAAEEAIEDACDVSFVPRTATEIVSGGGGGRFLSLRWPRVRYVNSVAVDLVDWAEPARAAVVVTPSGLYSPTAFPVGYGNVQVTYEHGYNAPPGRIKRAAMLLAESFLIRSGINDRATQVQAGDEQLWLAPREPFGIGEVDAAVRDYSFRLGFA